MSILSYIECYELRTCGYRSTWKKHTVERAVKASLLAECYACEKRLRQCSTRLWRAYRRLEDYAKCTLLVSTLARTGYGKLCEYTIYLKYESRKPSWSRHVETRVYVPVPLHIKCREEMKKAEEIAIDITTTWYGGDIPFEREGKIGVRELRGGQTTWCNDVTRVALDASIRIEIHDYRGYHYIPPPIYGGWCRWREM